MATANTYSLGQLNKMDYFAGHKINKGTIEINDKQNISYITSGTGNLSKSIAAIPVDFEDESGSKQSDYLYIPLEQLNVK